METGPNIGQNANDNYGAIVGLVTGGVVNLTTSSNTKLAIERPWLVPSQPLSPFFTGRRYILGKLKALLADQANITGQKCIALYGPAGIGKSEASLKFVLENRERYWGVFWIDASTADSANDCFHLARTLLGQDQGQPLPFVRSYLASVNKPWLIILDNANDPSISLGSLVPPGDSGHVLVTTRMQSLHNISITNYVEMPSMSQDTSVEFLKKRSTSEKIRDIPLNILGNIAREMEHNLLSLAWAADNIRGGRPPQEVLKLWREQLKASTPSTIEPSQSNSSDRRCGNANISFEIAFEELNSLPTHQPGLPDGSRSDAFVANNMLQQLTYLHRMGEPSVLFEASLQWKFKKNVDKMAARILQTRRAWLLLEKLSLVTLQAKGEQVISYQLHSTLYDWLRDRHNKSEARKYWRDAFDTVVTATRHLDSHFSVEAHWPELLSSQIGSVLQTHGKVHVDANSTSEPGDLQRYVDLTDVQLKTAGGVHLDLCSDFVKKELRKFLSGHKESPLSRGDATRVRDAYMKLFRVAEYQHEWRRSKSIAADFQNVTARLFAKTFLGHLWAAFATAKAEYYLKQFSRCVEVLQPTMTHYSHENSLWEHKPTDSGRIRVVTRIGVLLADAHSRCGAIGKAEELLKFLVESYRKHKEASQDMGMEVERALGGLYILSKDPTAALLQLEHIYSIESRTISPDNHQALRTCRRLGAMYRLIGKVPRSLKLLEHVVNTMERSTNKVPLLGVRLKEYIWTLELLEAVCRDSQDLAKAKAVHDKLLAVAENVPESMQKDWKILRWRSEEPEERMLVFGLGDI